MSPVAIAMASHADSLEIAAFARNHRFGEIQHTWEGLGLLRAGSGGRWDVHICVARQDGRIVGVMPCAKKLMRRPAQADSVL